MFAKTQVMCDLVSFRIINPMKLLARNKLLNKTGFGCLVILFLCVMETTFGQTPIPLSETDIQELVDIHNLFRSMVDPPASNIQRVVSYKIKACMNSVLNT